MRKQILVAGLGRFGQNLAVALEEMGSEVMGVDASEEAVSEVADRLTHAIIGDTTEEKTVRDIGVEQFDATVCAIGSNIEASVMTTVLLKELGARLVVAKASSSLHGKILQKIGADRVIYPEQEVALRLARDFVVPSEFVEVIPLTVRHSMFEIKTPEHFSGRTLAELDLRAKYGLNVVAVRRNGSTVVSPSADEVIRRADRLIVVGDRTRAEEAVKSKH